MHSKELQLINNSFQKYRKQVFLNTFDLAWENLGRLIERKRREQKKEGFTELINYCLRNEQFKRQYEELNESYFNQINKAKS